MLLKDLPNLRRISVMKTHVTNEGLERFKQISASKSITTKVRRRLISTRKEGLTAVVVQLPQTEARVPSLIGKSLLQLSDLNIELNPNQAKDKMILVCFFDMNQRPSRNCMRQLNAKAKELKAKDVVVVVVQTSKVDDSVLNEWVEKNNISFTVGMVQGDEEKIRFTWGVRSLPWLILTDTQHVVIAEGFSVAELDEKLNGNSH